MRYILNFCSTRHYSKKLCFLVTVSFVVVFSILNSSFAAVKNPCNLVISNKSKGIRDLFKLLLIQQSGPYAVSAKWIDILMGIEKTDINKFQKGVPGEYLPKFQNGNKVPFVYPLVSENKRIQSDSDADLLDRHTPGNVFYIQIFADEMSSILLNKQFNLTEGTHHTAAIPLREGSFPDFQKPYLPKDGLSLLRVELDPNAKLLDLTQEPFGERKASQLSFYDLYHWYVYDFLPKLKLDDSVSKNKFPALAQIARDPSIDKSLLESTEAFALLLGAQVVRISAKEGAVPHPLYLVLDPHIVKKVEDANAPLVHR